MTADDNGNANKSFLDKDIFQIMQEQLESRPLYEVVIESFLASLIAVVAFFGNLLTLYVVLKNRSLRTTPNMFVVSLAIVDLLMGVTVVFMAVVVLVTSKWVFNNGMCHFQAFVITFASVIALLTIAMTSLNRYFKIVRNNLYLRYFTKKKTLAMIICSWICGFIIPVPLLLPETTAFIPSKLVCFLNVVSKWRIYLALVMSAVVALPILIVTFCYIRIFLTVANHQSNAFQSSQGTATFVQEIKITRMTFAIVLCFIVCWTPAYIISMIDSARATFTLPRIAYLINSFGVGFSCGLNPLVYGLLNPTFRREYLKVLRWWKKSRRNNDVGPVSFTFTGR